MSQSAVLWVFALTFTVLGAVTGVAAYLKVRQIRRLVVTGIRAQGVVTRHEPTRLEGHGDATITIRSSGTTVYHPVIAWTTADDRPMETRWDIARPLDETLAIGARVEVCYDPADPSRWTLPAESDSLWWLFVGVGVLFAVMGLGFFFGALFS